jgi:hypothetical protein
VSDDHAGPRRSEGADAKAHAPRSFQSSSVPPTYANELELFVRSEESGAVSRRCTAPQRNFVSPEEELREALANKPPSRHFDYGGCTAAESVKAPASKVLTTIPRGGAPSWETGGCAVRATENGGWNQSELYSTTSSACSVEVELLSRRKSTVVTPYTSQGQAAKLPCVIYRGEIVSKPLAAASSRFPQPKGTDRGMPLDVAGEKDRKELESVWLVAPDSLCTPTMPRHSKLPHASHPAIVQSLTPNHLRAACNAQVTRDLSYQRAGITPMTYTLRPPPNSEAGVHQKHMAEAGEDKEGLAKFLQYSDLARDEEGRGRSNSHSLYSRNSANSPPPLSRLELLHRRLLCADIRPGVSAASGGGSGGLRGGAVGDVEDARLDALAREQREALPEPQEETLAQLLHVSIKIHIH